MNKKTGLYETLISIAVIVGVALLGSAVFLGLCKYAAVCGRWNWV